MKLYLMFLFMDVFMVLACSYLWIKSAFVHVLLRRLKFYKP